MVSLKSNRECSELSDMTRIEKNDSKIIFPELSYQIMGASFSVFNELGWGLFEKDYGRAMTRELESRKLYFQREVFIPLNYKGQRLSRYFADFIVGDQDKVIVELKVVSKLGYGHIHQLLPYLKSSGLKLGILIYFTKDGIKYRRVLNPSISS